MTDALVMLDDRHLRALGHRADKSLPAARHAQVHILRQRQQLFNRLAVGCRHDLDGLFGKGRQRPLACFDHDPRDGQIRVQGFLASAKNGCVAGLEAEAGGIGCHIGSRLIDDDHHANRRADLPQLQAIGADTLIQHTADGVGECGDFPQALGHSGDAFVIELQSVEHGGGKAHLRADFHVERIGFLDRGGVMFERVGHREQATVLVGSGEPRQLT